ncbi:MAG: hypothetical protein R2811_11930 [Flavobacteriales bacterium]
MYTFLVKGLEREAKLPNFDDVTMWQMVWMAFRPVTRSLVLTIIWLGSAIPGSAQFELGLAGGSFFDLVSAGSGSTGVFVSNGPQVPISMALLYRERARPSSNFFAEVAYSIRTIDVELDRIGLGSSDRVNALVDLHLLHIGMGPEFTMGRTALRFGPQFGLNTYYRTEGTRTTDHWSPGSVQQRVSDQVNLKMNGDLRLLWATRVDLVRGARWKLVLDLYVSVGVTSVLEDPDTWMRLQDLGSRLGLHRVFSGRGFWRTLRAGSPALGAD